MNLTSNFPRVLFLATTLMFATSALAAMDEGKPQCMRKGGGHFSQADTNNDGSIDKAEAQAMHDRHFEQMDADHDGKIDRNEMKACMRQGPGMGRMGGGTGFMKADKDNDGTLDREEAEALPRIGQHFDDIDADKDGTVSMDEVHNYMMNQR